jgi:hypothetical protein
MKLLFCPECGDVKKLAAESRSCACGESWGCYKPDGLRVDVYGPALVIGLDNIHLNRVLSIRERLPDENLTLAAWVMSDKTPNVNYHRGDSHV